MDDSHIDDPATPGHLSAPVPTRARHDGWTPERQQAFIAALAESGCVGEACKAVGVSRHSAYRLRARPEATIFRQAWDVALDYAIRNLSDAALSRALHGTPRPVFYRGEQVGEWRHYDERLTMFLLRYRDPVRYGAWLDGMEARRHPDGAGIVLAHALNAVADAAHGFLAHDDPDLPPPALADGPPRTRVPLPPEEEAELTPEQAELMAKVRACIAPIEDRAADPLIDDWQSTLPVRRPRGNRR